MLKQRVLKHRDRTRSFLVDVSQSEAFARFGRDTSPTWARGSKMVFVPAFMPASRYVVLDGEDALAAWLRLRNEGEVFFCAF